MCVCVVQPVTSLASQQQCHPLLMRSITDSVGDTLARERRDSRRSRAKRAHQPFSLPLSLSFTYTHTHTHKENTEGRLKEASLVSWRVGLASLSVSLC